VSDLFDTSVPLWYLAVLNPALARARNLGITHLMFGAYPRERTKEVQHKLRSLVESNRGRLLPTGCGAKDTSRSDRPSIRLVFPRVLLRGRAAPEVGAGRGQCYERHL
jgi:hypothetical protein